VAGTWVGACSILDLADLLRAAADAYRSLEVLGVPFDEEEAPGLPGSVKDSLGWASMFAPAAYAGW
jgi:hypothetical protein